MKLAVLLLLLSTTRKPAIAFIHPPRCRHFSGASSFLFANPNTSKPPLSLTSQANQGDDKDECRVQLAASLVTFWGRKVTVAGAILAAVAVTPLAATTLPVQPAQAVEISTGALTIQTSANLGSGLVDTKTLIATLIKNRKQVGASLERILDAVKQELSSPVWREIQTEVLQIEGDVADVKILPPADSLQTLKDLSKGKLNFILNGEIINVAVDEKFSREEDELVIRVQGFKGRDLSGGDASKADVGFGSSITNVYARRWAERAQTVQGLWDTSLGVQVGGTDVTAGPVVVGGLALTIAGAYGSSYSYYVGQKAEQEAAAEAKRKEVAAKRAAAAAKRAKEE